MMFFVHLITEAGFDCDQDSDNNTDPPLEECDGRDGRDGGGNVRKPTVRVQEDQQNRTHCSTDPTFGLYD